MRFSAKHSQSTTCSKTSCGVASSSSIVALTRRRRAGPSTANSFASAGGSPTSNRADHLLQLAVGRSDYALAGAGKARPRRPAWLVANQEETCYRCELHEMGQAILSRVRVAFGLAGVAAGTAWAVGGANALSASALVILKVVPALTVMVGVLILLRAVVPRGVLAGPLVLIVGGSAVLAFQFDVLTAGMLGRVGPTLLVAGGVVVAMSRRSREGALVARHWSVFAPIKPIGVQGIAPQKFILRCLLGEIRLDLAKAHYPGMADRITVDITLLGGWVELRVPQGWPVRAGRVDLARGTRFVGNLSSPIPVLDAPEVEDEANLIVLNVQGWSGRVTITRDQPADPPPSGSGSARSVPL